MSTENNTKPKGFGEYLAGWLGFVSIFAFCGVCLATVLGVYFRSIILLYFCLIAGTMAGVVVGSIVVVIVKLDDIKSSSIVIGEFVQSSNEKKKSFFKKDYVKWLVVCSIFGIIAGIFYCSIASEMANSIAIAISGPFIGLGFGLVIGLVMIIIHYFQNLRNFYSVPMAQVRTLPPSLKEKSLFPFPPKIL